MSFLVEYHLYIMITVFIGLFFLPTEYRKKKTFITVMVLLAFSIGYEFVMQEPVTKMPGRINRTLNDKGPEHTTNPNYYKIPGANL